jgi:hypothetical protein
VDTRGDDPRCDCPDATHRGATCKHARRVAYAIGERTIPAHVDRDDVDEHLGRHVDGPVFAGVDAVDTTSEQPVATDGGSDPSDWTFTDTSANPTGVCERDGCDGNQRKSLTVPGEGKRIVCRDCYFAYRDRGRSSGTRAVVGAGR